MANHGNIDYTDSLGYTHYSDGTTSYEMGGTTFYSDGTTSYEMGGTTFYNDGSTSYEMDHTIFHSDGSTSKNNVSFADYLTDVFFNNNNSSSSSNVSTNSGTETYHESNGFFDTLGIIVGCLILISILIVSILIIISAFSFLRPIISLLF